MFVSFIVSYLVKKHFFLKKRSYVFNLESYRTPYGELVPFRKIWAELFKSWLTLTLG